MGKKIIKWSAFLEESKRNKSKIWPVGIEIIYDSGALPTGLSTDNVHVNDILNLQKNRGLTAAQAPGTATDWLITYCSQPTNEDPSTLEGRVNDLEVSSVVKVDVGGSREDSFLEFDQMDLSQNNEKFLTIKSADNPGVTIGEFETPNGNKVVFRAPAPSIENLDVSVEQSSDTADPDNSKIPTTAKVGEMMDAVGLSIDKSSRDEIVHSSSTSTWIELTTPLHAGVKYILTSDVTNVTMYVNRNTSVGSHQLYTSSPLYLTPEVDITSIRLYRSGGYGGNGMNLRIRDFLGATSRLTKIDNAVSANSHSIPTAPGALVVRNAIPSYFLNDLFGSKTHEKDLNLGANESDPDPNPINLYLDKIINSVPEGRSIITWADQHWEGGNKKHSPELISYVRQRLGIRRVAMLGDVIDGVPTSNNSLTASEQGAIDVLTDFSAKAIAATGYDCALPCTGNHDANTQGDSSEDDDSDGAETSAYLHPVNMYNALFRHTRCHTFYDDNKDGIDAIIAAAEGKTADDAANLIAACKMSYYVDDALLRTRFVAISGNIGSALSNYISTGKYAYMFQWLLDTIGDTPEGYDLAILTHSFDGWTEKNGAGSTTGGAQFALALMARKLRINYRGYMNTPTNVRSYLHRVGKYSFPHDNDYYATYTECKQIGKVYMLTGHSHRDSTLYLSVSEYTSYTNFKIQQSRIGNGSTHTIDQNTNVNNGCDIPIIITPSDCFGVNNPNNLSQEKMTARPVMTEKTITEQCFNILTILPNELHITRVGAKNNDYFVSSIQFADQQSE